MELTVRAVKSFGSFTLDVERTLRGERIGVFGPSGGGKSTFVRLIAGLEAPANGEITLDGEVLFCSTRRINLPPHRRRIAVVFQDPRLFSHLSVRDNLLYGARRCRDASARAIDFARLVEILALDELLERGVDKLSGGQKQRVALGRAILANPRLLIMDEPLSALDDTLRYQIIPFLRSVSEEFAIPYLFISHAMNEIRLLCDEVLVLHHGRIADQATPDELARKRMGRVRAGYINLLRLGVPTPQDDLFAYPFGDATLMLWEGAKADTVFELSSTDIMLFRGRPEAISARNLLTCRVKALFPLENRVGVELDCGGETLIATVVRQAAAELDLLPGHEVCAVIKASAFRRLC